MRKYLSVIVPALLAATWLVVPGYGEVSLPNGGWDAAWSPDGSSIAFTSGSPHGIPNLWLVRADRTGLRQMTTRGAHNPSWLIDGKTIVFGSLRNGVSVCMSIDATGEPGSEKPVEAVPPGADGALWSPDSSLIAYGVLGKNATSRDLWFARASGGGRTGLTSNFWCREWTWSPDGGKIAFIVGKATGTSIWTVEVASKAVRLLYKGFCGALSYSPDGKQLALAVPDVKSGFKIAIIELASGTVKTLAVQTFNGQKLIWSTDGSQLFFVSSRKSEAAIWSIGADGKNLTRLTPAGKPTTGPALSPDGQRLACQVFTQRSYGPELAVCATSGAKMTMLTSSSPSFWSPLWSPDGKKLAFQSDLNHSAALFVGSPSGRMGKALTQLYGTTAGEVLWLPDGKKLLVADSGRLLTVNAAGGKNAVKPFSKLTSQVQGPRLIGNEIIVTELGFRDAHLTAVKPDGSGHRFLTQQADDQPPPSDEKAAKPEAGAAAEPGAESEAGNPHAELGLVGPQANLSRSQRPPRVDLWAAASPDGKTIAFARNDQIWLVGADGAAVRQVTRLKAPEGAHRGIGGPCWSPKGDSILFSAFTKDTNKLTFEIWVCSTEAGSERLIYTENVDTEYGAYYFECTSPPTFMPDGSGILFTSIADGQPSIVSVGLDGSTLRQIVPGPATFPALDPSGKRLAYVDASNSRERIRILDMSTGKPSKLLFR